MQRGGSTVNYRLLLEDRLFPVQCFFNAVSDYNFVEIVGRLLQGIGHGTDYAQCTFPEDLEPGEEVFEGVRFSIFEESVILTVEELRYFIDKACESYIADHPEDRNVIRGLLSIS
jgi:CDI immunity protein